MLRCKKAVDTQNSFVLYSPPSKGSSYQYYLYQDMHKGSLMDLGQHLAEEFEAPFKISATTVRAKLSETSSRWEEKKTSP